MLSRYAKQILQELSDQTRAEEEELYLVNTLKEP
jgi:hypothetical protein